MILEPIFTWDYKWFLKLNNKRNYFDKHSFKFLNLKS